MATTIPHNWLSAAEKFSKARFPERGRPLDGSKNLRLVMLDGQFNPDNAIYAVRLHNSYIAIFRREIMSPIWSMCGWDSVTTKHHVNSLDGAYVWSHKNVMFAGHNTMQSHSEHVIDSDKYYMSDEGRLWEFAGPYDMAPREMRGVTRVPVYRGVPKSRDIMVNPKAGDMFAIGDATYVWTRTHWINRQWRKRCADEIVLLRYHGSCEYGSAPWSDEKYAYLDWEPGMSDLTVDNILWLAKATSLIDRGAKPAKPFTGEPYTGETKTFAPWVREDTDEQQ